MEWRISGRSGLKRMVGTLAVLGLLLAACGGDGEDGQSQPTPAETDTTATETPTEETSPVAEGACPADAPSEPISIVFQPATESMAVLTQLVAFGEGYLEDEGLDVTYNTPIPNAAQVAQSVTQPDVDIAGTGSTGVVAVAAAGRDMVSIGIISKAPTTILTLTNDAIEEIGVSPDAPIEERMEALRGRTLGLPAAGSSTDVLIRTTLESFGIDPERDLTIQPIGEVSALVAAAREGQIDGYAFSPPTSVLPVAEGFGQIWVSYPRGDVPQFASMPLTDLVTSTTFIEENPEAVCRFLRAFWRAAEDLRTDPESVKAKVKEQWFAELDQELYEASFDAVLPGFQDGLIPTQEGFDVLLETVNATADTPVEISYDEMYFLELTEETQP